MEVWLLIEKWERFREREREILSNIERERELVNKMA